MSGQRIGERRFRKEHPYLVAALEARGWRIETTTNGHLRFMPPDGSKPILASGTPRCAWNLTVHELRKKAGL